MVRLRPERLEGRSRNRGTSDMGTELVWNGEAWERLEPIEPDPSTEPVKKGTVRIKQARDLAGRLVWSVRDGVTVRNFNDQEFRTRVLWEIFRYASNMPKSQRVTFIV